MTDDDGKLVADLSKADFQILENGKPQTIAVFTPVTIPFEQAPTTLIEGRPLKFDVANNDRVRDGRVYVIVLDDYHIGSIRPRSRRPSASSSRSTSPPTTRWPSSMPAAAATHRRSSRPTRN